MFAKALSLLSVAVLALVVAAPASFGQTSTTAPPAATQAPAPPAAAPSTAGEPTVPRFSDPRRRPERPAEDLGPIRFLTSGDFPPLNFLDAGGRLTGFHVDLARAVCEELNVSCTIQMRPFGDLLQALDDRRGDAVIAGIAATADTRLRLAFSEAYLTLPGRFLARRGAGVDVTRKGLAGRWIAVVDRSAHAAFVADFFPEARIAAYPTDTAARDALRDGSVDVMFGDAMAGAFWIGAPASRDCCTFAGGPFTETAYFGEGLKVAVAKSNTKLKRAVDYALQKLVENGRFGELYLRWFPVSYF